MQSPIDLKPFFKEFSTQIIIVLAIIGIIAMIVGVATQSFAKGFGIGIGVILLAGLILALNNLEKMGDWVNKTIFKAGVIDPGQLITLAKYSVMRFFT